MTQIQKFKPTEDIEQLSPPGNDVGSWASRTLIPWLNEQIRQIRLMLRRITIANMSATLASTTTPGVANTEFNVTHNLGRIPVIYIWNVDTAGAVIYKGATAWTSTLIYLKCNVANVGVTLLIM